MHCPNCDEDELQFESDCQYCGWPEVACETCNGSGMESYWVGVYGTSSCNGEAERVCVECHGQGYLDA